MTTQDTESKIESGGRNWLVLIGGLAVLVFVALVFIYGLNPLRQGSDTAVEIAENAGAEPSGQVIFPESGPPLQVGDIPYNFNLADLQGGQVALQEFAGAPLIINYWATWCGPCRIEMPHLQNTFESHQEDGLVLLALDQDETPAEVSAFFDEFGLTFTALMDKGNTASGSYGVGRTLPTSFFINAEGAITAIHRGPMTQGQIDDYLAETLP